MTTPLLTSTISKTFDNGVKAVGDVSLAVNAGDFLSLVGPSGCGKSTVLRIIAGLLATDSGAVTFPQVRPEIGFVFQEPTLMPWATVAKNARLPLDLKHVSHAPTRKRVPPRRWRAWGSPASRMRIPASCPAG